MNKQLFTAIFGLVLAVITLGNTVIAGPVEWPADRDRSLQHADPIAPIRWNAEGWVAASGRVAEQVLLSIDTLIAQGMNSPQLVADRAVTLRVLRRFDDARSVLASAVSRDRSVLSDPDVALTQAYLLAMQQHYADAVSIARGALPRITASRELRSELAVELASWSMARGLPGLDDAIAILREVSFDPPEPMVRAMLSLALLRQDHLDEAREVARSGQLPSPFTALSHGARGALISGESDAAAGISLLLAGRPREAIDPLTHAATTVPAIWRASVNESLTLARRTAGPVSIDSSPSVRSPGRR